MVMPFGATEFGEVPSVVKGEYKKWWWVLFGAFLLLAIARVVASDVFGAFFTALMGLIVWYMVKAECANMTQYCLALYGFLCAMNCLLEIFTVATSLNGRSTRTQTESVTGDGATSYTIVVQTFPFFD